MLPKFLPLPCCTPAAFVGADGHPGCEGALFESPRLELLWPPSAKIWRDQAIWEWTLGCLGVGLRWEKELLA